MTGEREHTAARGTGWLFCGRAGLSVAWIFPARQWVRQVAFFLSGQFLTRISAPIHARWPEIRPETGAWLPFCMQGDPRLGLISRALLDGDAGDPLQELEQAAQAQLGMLWMLQAGLRAGSNDPADAAVDRAVQTARIPPGEARKIHQARQILLREYAGPPTIAQLARRVSLNEFKLKQGYRRAFATSIYADLKQHRMQLARDLLLTGESSVAAVACAVGYSNPGHFARAFRERYGLNPGQLLRACPGHSI